MVEDDQGLVASLLVVEGRTNLRIEGIQVAKRCQRQGWGRMLLAHAVRRAKARGLARVTLEVRRDNARAIAVYAQFGFRRVGTIPGFYADGETAVRMRRDVARTT